MKIEGFVYRPKRKRNGESHEEQTWRCRFRIPGRKPIDVTTKTHDKEAAEQFLLEKKADAAKQKYTLPTREMLEGWLETYLEDQRKKVDESTWARYEYCKDALLGEKSPLTGLRLNALTVGHVSDYLTYRLSGGARKPTILKEVIWLKGALTEARIQRLISVDTLQDIRDVITPKKAAGLRGATNPRDRYLTPKEIEIIYAAIPKNNPNLRDAFLLALFTGLRQKNVLELTEGQVTLDAHPPVVRYSAEQMKSPRAHVVQLSPQAAEVIRRRYSDNIPETPDRRLFHDFRPAWKRLRKKLAGKVDNFRWHDLKHTYGTYRIGAGADVRTVQGELAHTSPHLTLRIYAHVILPDERAFARQHFAWDLGTPPPAAEMVRDGDVRPLQGQPFYR